MTSWGAMSGSLIFSRRSQQRYPRRILHFVHIQSSYIKMKTLCPTKKEKDESSMRAAALFYLSLCSQCPEQPLAPRRQLVNSFCVNLFISPFLKNIFIMYINLGCQFSFSTLKILWFSGFHCLWWDEANESSIWVPVRCFTLSLKD